MADSLERTEALGIEEFSAETATDESPVRRATDLTGVHVLKHDELFMRAAGFARYGLDEAARKVASAMLEVSLHFRDARLPELFCGFERSNSPLPVPYPVACSPQAWAAASLFHVVHATLGMRPDASASRLELVSPSLPEWLPDLRLRNLRVGDAVVDLGFTLDGSIAVEVLRRSGELDVVVRL